MQVWGDDQGKGRIYANALDCFVIFPTCPPLHHPPCIDDVPDLPSSFYQGISYEPPVAAPEQLLGAEKGGGLLGGKHCKFFKPLFKHLRLHVRLITSRPVTSQLFTKPYVLDPVPWHGALKPLPPEMGEPGGGREVAHVYYPFYSNGSEGLDEILQPSGTCSYCKDSFFHPIEV